MLEVKNLNMSYGIIPILWDINFKIKSHEFVSLIGPNGAGKTSLLKCIAGLAKHTGMITFFGERIDGLPPHIIARKGIVLVPEIILGVFPRLTVRENLMIGSYLNMEKFAENLEWVYNIFPRLKEREKQLAGTLSGGERQMLNIARALMSKPKLLMLDEPSTGLAPKIVGKIFKTIKEIQQRGISILLVEQNAFMSLKISDRSYVIEQGKISLEGKSEKLINDPKVKAAYMGI